MRRPPFSPIAGIDDLPMPTCPEQATENLQKLAETTRRTFLGRGLAAAAAVPTALAASSIAEAAGPKKAPPTSNNSGNGNSLPTYYAGQTSKLFQEIQVNEATHVNILLIAIKSLGGTPRPYPTFQGITTSNAQQFLQLSNTFENTGVHAYFGAAGYIQNPAVLAVAASIGFVEAYHSGWLNALSNTTLVPGGITYATPLTAEQVVTAVSPYIVSLNDPNNMFPPTFSTTPSPANDIAILNFALIAEYLEATFYFNSVPKVFPGAI